MPRPPRIGNYVIATQYHEGNPNDHFAVGWLLDEIYDHDGELRYVVVDDEGLPFRNNGFRRCIRISARRGQWFVEHLAVLEYFKDKHSVWWWFRQPFFNLDGYASKPGPQPSPLP